MADVIRWANQKGYTLILSGEEVDPLIHALQRIKRTLHEELGDLDINYSPILEKED